MSHRITLELAYNCLFFAMGNDEGPEGHFREIEEVVRFGGFSLLHNDNTQKFQ